MIVGVGEVLWDVYPDAAHFGGAPANFACHAASLGAESWMVSAVGTDDLGDRAFDSLREKGVKSQTVMRDPTHVTGQVLVTLDATGQPRYEFAADPAWDHLTWSDQLASLTAGCDAVCFGTLCQRSTISRATIRRFVESTPATTLRVFDVNLRQRFYDAYLIEDSLEFANALKLNEEELPIVLDLLGIQVADRGDALLRLIDRYQLRLAALTCGPDGAMLATESESSRSPALPAKVIDTVGAGDAFTATLVMDFLRGLPLTVINEHANAVASFVCSQRGATPPLPADLKSSRWS